MSEKLRQILKSVRETKLPSGLEGLVLTSLRREQEKMAWRKLVSSYIGLAGSLVAAFLMLSIFGGELLHSDFWSMFSLVFSDMEIITHNGSDFAMLLLENFPTVSAFALLVPFFILFWSLGNYFEVAHKNKLRHA